MTRNHPAFLRLLLGVGLACLPCFGQAQTPDSASSPLPFWYNAPAADWKSAIPLGNGRLGAMIFGGVRSEQILLNENSIWAGPPVPADNPRGPELLPQIRALLFAGKYAEAEALCRREFMSPDPGEKPRSYQPLGFLRLDHEVKAESATDYRRSLDYEQAVAEVQFRQEGVEYRRETFASAPDQVIVVRLAASRSGEVSFTAALDRPAGAASEILGGRTLHFFGQAVDAKGQHAGVKFDALAAIVPDGGTFSADGGRLRVSGADSATIFIAVATDYNLADPSSPLSRNRLEECRRQLARAIAKGYPAVRADHIADYQRLYRRSTLDLPATPNRGLPLDQRIALAARGADDPELLLIYYRYCRYILISASRPGGLPANLQGLWNPMMAPPWASDYHLNINLQEAYWFAEQANLPECHEPLFALTEGLMRRGADTARTMLGVRRGSMAPFHTDVWMFTAPTGAPKYGMYVVGGAWCAQDFMEHYRFTQDRAFLQQRAYPVLRAAALFFVDWLVPDPKTGKLVSGPSTSPENSFRAPDGTVASISMGPTHDQEIIWNTFRDYLEAARDLGIENGETGEVRSAWARLALPRIASDGRLMEWPEEFQEVEPGHRHLSHLWGFMPGNRITLEGTPELAAAVAKSLDYRLAHNYDAQGWSLGWVANVMARLKEGDRALALMSNRYFGKAWPNLFVNAHGQVQVTDMMGLPLAMIELLLQSHAGEVDLLPALPKRWESGRATGLCARGGFVIDLVWREGKLTSAVMHSVAGGIGRFRYQGKLVELPTEAGKTYALSF